MSSPTAFSALCAAAVLFSAVLSFAQTTENKEEDTNKKGAKRPALSLRATPGTGMVPVRISATAEFKGGDDDFEDYYCPTVEWNWGDGTVSEASADCEPYEAGVSEIRRRYTGSHNYKRSGAYRIIFRLKVKDRVLVVQTTSIRLLGGGF